jgi:5-methylcytosine-specific restriction protein A
LCQVCTGKTPRRLTPASEVHHVKARADGGTDNPENLIAICSDCHTEATAARRGGTLKPKRRYDRLGYRIADD